MTDVTLFISAVSDEFRPYRKHLDECLTRVDVSVKIQDSMPAGGVPTLLQLDDYIRRCDAVIHLLGAVTGAPVAVAQQLTHHRKPLIICQPDSDPSDADPVSAEDSQQRHRDRLRECGFNVQIRFTNPQDLCIKLLRSVLLNMLREKPAKSLAPADYGLQPEAKLIKMARVSPVCTVSADGRAYSKSRRLPGSRPEALHLLLRQPPSKRPNSATIALTCRY